MAFYQRYEAIQVCKCMTMKTRKRHTSPWLSLAGLMEFSEAPYSIVYGVTSYVIISKQQTNHKNKSVEGSLTTFT